MGHDQSIHLFSDAERAALDYVTEPTKGRKVNPNTFALLFRKSDLRDCLVCCHRTSLQYDRYRTEHSFGYALRHRQEESDMMQRRSEGSGGFFTQYVRFRHSHSS